MDQKTFLTNRRDLQSRMRSRRTDLLTPASGGFTMPPWLMSMLQKFLLNKGAQLAQSAISSVGLRLLGLFVARRVQLFFSQKASHPTPK